MLRITFTPPGGGEPRLWEFTDMEDSLHAKEGELIEDLGGKQWDTFMGWAFQMSQGSIKASRVLMWVLIRREQPELAFEDFDFPMSALLVEETQDEGPPEPGKDEPGATDTGTP